MDANVFSYIKEMALHIVPNKGHVILFGSRARGDSHDGSDWDLLILLDKEKIEESDHDKYSYPFWELGWKLNEMIHPIIYTASDWKTNKSMFHYNVEKEGIKVC